MNVEPFLISSTVNAVVGQRLVRKICPYCLESYVPEPGVITNIIDNFGLRKEFLASIEKQPTPEKIVPKVEVGGVRKIPISYNVEAEKKSILEKIAKDPSMINRSTQEAEEIALRDKIFLSEGGEEKLLKDKKIKNQNLTLTLYRGEGCNKCNNTGYLGRLGIYEVIEVDDEIGKLIIGHASTSEIQHTAIKNGMITMQQDGFLKSLEGLTTFEEILRVTRE
jgi:type II secretory ATPase GspE/PulE/Tfp pilus assembly ATPase PilB-like protein